MDGRTSARVRRDDEGRRGKNRAAVINRKRDVNGLCMWPRAEYTNGGYMF